MERNSGRGPLNIGLQVGIVTICAVSLLGRIGAEADPVTERAASASLVSALDSPTPPHRETALFDIGDTGHHASNSVPPSAGVVAEGAEPAASVPAAAAADHQKSLFDLSQVERIRLRVLGNTELTGVYNVDADDSISIPRVGRLAVKGMTLAKLEATLAQKLREATRDDATASVEVDRYRPFYVSGRVARPGSIEWRPGLKVIEAYTLAGGASRPTENSEARVHQTQTQLTFARVRLERLRAEKEGASAVEVSARMESLVKSAPLASQELLANLLSRQNAMLNENQSILREKLAGLQREQENAKNQLDAAQQQEHAVESQLTIARTIIADYDKLLERQLVTKSRYLTQHSDVLNCEARLAETHSLVARAKSQLETIEQQIASIPRQQSAQLNERIEALERDVAQFEIMLTDANGLEAGSELDLRYRIARKVGGSVETIEATVFTDVLPGDIVMVAPKPDAGIASLTASPTRLGAVSTPQEVGIASVEQHDTPATK